MTDDRMEKFEDRRCVEQKDEKQCGNTFVITKGEAEFYKSKGMELPKRCPSCRLARRSSIKTTMQVPLKD